MKIAILYSGYIRNIAESIYNNIDFFKTISDNIDLYFSTWDNVGYADNINSPDFIHSKRIIDAKTIVSEELILRIIPPNVSIKSIKIESYDPKNYSFDLINGATNSISAQFYKIYDCYTLLNNNIKYDTVIRMRCDFLFGKKIDKNTLYNALKDNKIIFASKIWYNFIKENHIKHINDMFWIAPNSLIGRTCNIYNNAINMNKIIIERNQTHNNFGEDICYMNLEAEGLINNIYTFDFDYNILR